MEWRILYFLLLLLGSTELHCQAYNLDSPFTVLKTDVQEQRDYNAGTFVWDDDTRENYYLLLSESSLEDLTTYLDDEDPYVRSLIFKGLADRNPEQSLLDRYLEISKSNSGLMKIKSGGILSSWTEYEYYQAILKNTIETNVDYDNLIADIRANNVLKLDGERHNRMSKPDIEKLKSLKLNHKEFSVVSFSLWIKSGSRTKEFTGTGPKLTEEMRQALKKLRTGDEFSLESIRIASPDGLVRKLPSKTILVK